MNALLVLNLVATLAILAVLLKTRNSLMAAIDDVKAAFDAYAAKVGTYMATVDKAVADAIAADDAGEEVDLAAFAETIKAAAAKVPPTT